MEENGQQVIEQGTSEHKITTKDIYNTFEMKISTKIQVLY